MATIGGLLIRPVIAHWFGFRYCVHDAPVACCAGRARLLCGVALVFGRRWELVHTRALPPPSHAPMHRTVFIIHGFHHSLFSSFEHIHSHTRYVRGGARGACSIQQTAVRVAQQSLPNGSIVCKGP